MMKLVLGTLLCTYLLPSLSQARDCVPPPSTTSLAESSNAASENFGDAAYENVGVYEWDEAQQAWVLLHATYVPYYETETMRTGDTLIDQSTFWGGGGGGGGGGGDDMIQKDAGDILTADGPCTLPPVTVAGGRPSFGSSMISIMWRGQSLNFSGGSGNVAQRRVIQAPPGTQPITCSDEPDVRIGNAQHALANSGISNGSRFRNREFTVRFSTGTTETYIHLGVVSTYWLAIKPGTCKAG